MRSMKWVIVLAMGAMPILAACGASAASPHGAPPSGPASSPVSSLADSAPASAVASTALASPSASGDTAVRTPGGCGTPATNQRVILRMPTAAELDGALGLKLVEGQGLAGLCAYTGTTASGAVIKFDISCRNDYADIVGGVAVSGLGLQSSYLEDTNRHTTQLITKYRDAASLNACSAGFDANAPGGTKVQEIAAMRLVIAP